MCDGVPAYQADGDDGPALFRRGSGDGGSNTRWVVADSSALETCDDTDAYLGSAVYYHGPPTALAYSMIRNMNGGIGFTDLESPDEEGRPKLAGLGCLSDCGITITAGGR